MITNSGAYEDKDTVERSLKGLSTDTKPTGTYDGKKIANGSTFMEIDTKTLYYYDAASETWV